MGFRASGLRAEGMGFRVCRLGSGSGVHYPARGPRYCWGLQEYHAYGF